MREFNLEEAKAGKPVCTRDGRNARIICFDAKNEHYPIVALIEQKDEEFVNTFCPDGHFCCSISEDEDNSFDLFMASEKHVGYINIVDDGHGNRVGSCIWKTREEAESNKPLHCISTQKIEWEE